MGIKQRKPPKNTTITQKQGRKIAIFSQKPYQNYA